MLRYQHYKAATYLKFTSKVRTINVPSWYLTAPAFRIGEYFGIDKIMERKHSEISNNVMTYYACRIIQLFFFD